jgi:hypothetical protein
LPPELRKNALLISQSGSSNFALYMIRYLIGPTPPEILNSAKNA